MNITYYGHACFSVETGGKNLLFDPFITPNERAKHIDINSVKPDFMLITHGHEDHVADAVTIAKSSGCTVVSNFEIVTWFGKQGVENGHPMNHGGTWSFDFGKVQFVNAAHSSTLPDGTFGGNPGGFVVSTSEGTFYHAGDTALTYDMKLIADSHQLNFALLPIGDNFTMGIDDAVKAAGFINCSKIIGMHYDTFGYVEIDHDEAKQKFADAGIEFILMEIGQKLSI